MGDLVQHGVLDGTLSMSGSKPRIIVEPIYFPIICHVGILMLQALATSNKLVEYYRLVHRLLEFLGFIPMALQMMFVYLTSELWFNNRTEKTSELAGRTMQYTFLLTGILPLGLIILTWVINIQPLVLRIHCLLSLVIIPPLGLAVFTFFYCSTRALEPGEFLGCSYRCPTRSVHRLKHFKQNTN